MKVEEPAGKTSAGDAVATPAGLVASPPIQLTIKNTWKEGKTLEDVSAVLKQVQEIAMSVEGVIGFQYAIDEENKTNTLTEVYESPAVIDTFTAAMTGGEENVQAKLLETITTVETRLSGPKEAADQIAKGLAAFSPLVYYTDAVGPGFKTQTKTVLAAPPIQLTIKNKWKEGKSEAEVAAVLAKTQQAALEVDGVYGFQYAMNPETKENTLTEVYKDMAAVQAFQGAFDNKELLSTIESTEVRLSGPKEAITPFAEELKKGFATDVYAADAVGPAFKYGA